MMKWCIPALLAAILLSTPTPARASLYADFWAVDADGGGVTVDLSLFTTPATLWFSSDQTTWFKLAKATDPFSALTASLSVLDTSHLFLRLDLAGTVTPLLKSMAAVKPEEPQLFYSGSKGDGLYNSLAIQWTGLGSQFAVTTLGIEGADAMSANNPVPIPPAGLLFSTGLIGFIALRRKGRMSET